MSVINAPVSGPLLLFLPIALVGTIVLYDFHASALKNEVAASATHIAEQARALRQARDELLQVAG